MRKTLTFTFLCGVLNLVGCDGNSDIDMDSPETATEAEIAYDVTADGLVNQEVSCGIDLSKRHNAADEQPWGVRFSDDTPYPPARVVLELNVGIYCSALEARDVALNGTVAGTVTFDANCTCAASAATRYTIELDPAAYQVGAENTVTVSAGLSNEGLTAAGSPFGDGIFARVTVYPASAE